MNRMWWIFSEYIQLYKFVKKKKKFPLNFPDQEITLKVKKIPLKDLQTGIVNLLKMVMKIRASIVRATTLTTVVDSITYRMRTMMIMKGLIAWATIVADSITDRSKRMTIIEDSFARTTITVVDTIADRLRTMMIMKGLIVPITIAVDSISRIEDLTEKKIRMQMNLKKIATKTTKTTMINDAT